MDSTTPTMHESPWPIGGVMIALLIGAWISFGVYIRRGITLVSWLQQGSYALGTKPVIGARPVFPSDANVHTMVIGYQDSAGKPQICCAKTKKPEVLLCIERPMVLFRSKPDGTKEAILADMIPGMDEMEEMDHDVAAARRFAMKYCCLPTLCLAGHLAYGLASLLALLIGAYAW